ncbi:hypothetical protein Lal_00048301 [Lupinus albus]|nr:hypothetical protein Lal_00048301 [Lupinus albus]
MVRASDIVLWLKLMFGGNWRDFLRTSANYTTLDNRDNEVFVLDDMGTEYSTYVIVLVYLTTD